MVLTGQTFKNGRQPGMFGYLISSPILSTVDLGVA